MSPRKNVTPTQLGNHIIRRRNLKKWNTAELARQANLPYTTVRNVEKGSSKKPDEKILRALIKALGCDEGVVFAYAGYGDIPPMTQQDVVLSLRGLGDVAPLWRATIERVINEMAPEQQQQALNVLQAQLNGASHHSKDRQ